MKLIVLFLSTTLFMQFGALDSCHTDMASHDDSISEISDAHSSPCHGSESEKEDEGHDEQNCSGCMSACCHYFAFKSLEIKPSFLVESETKLDNWPIIHQYKNLFLSENFRPPIYS